MRSITDQLNRRVQIPEFPERIVSLVPSQTELLMELGLGDRLTGVTKFCIHPSGVKKGKAVVGGTKNFNFDKIEALCPDLIIGNKEENYKEGIERLARKYPVWVSDIHTLDDAIEMIRSIGMMTKTDDKARKIESTIRYGFSQVVRQKGSAVYLIWMDPLIVVGKNTFVDVMLERAGYRNCIEGQRYPETSIEKIKKLNPSSILLSSEPYPFLEKHLMIFKAYFPDAEVRLVDGEMFSWYGSRLQYAMDYFMQL